MRKLSEIKRGLVIIIIVAGILGFADATYLSILHFANIVPPCSILQGCEKVTTSRYSVIAGVPLALVGTIYYLAIFILSVAYLDKRKIILIKIVGGLSVLAFLGSLALIYLQLFVIGSICPYCMFSALTSTTIFVSVLLAYFQKPKVLAGQTKDSVGIDLH